MRLLCRPLPTGRGDTRGGAVEIRVEEAGIEDLVAHASIPIAFWVDRILEPDPLGGPLDFVEHPHPNPWLKDYDSEEGANPALWPSHFDTSGWRIISAWAGASRVGGVVLFADVPEVDMLEGRSDLALIWDLRVTPPFRGRGVGRRLVSSAVAWD